MENLKVLAPLDKAFEPIYRTMCAFKARAEKENVDIAHASILPVDNHELHLDTHIRFVISGQAEKISAAYQQALLDHISLHKKMMSQPSIKE